ncbi:MAG: nucleotidyltransferase family protein [Oscillospiraceae bacterium]|nr:nucleotidyltransferase family protein [Oscillospiraceae bacterium]
MASGLGRRFGGNKLMATLGGKPIVQWGIDAAKDVFSKMVVVTRHEDVAALCEVQGIHVVLHDLPYRSDTVRLGLEALGDVSHCLFLPGDQPFVTAQSLWALVLAAQNTDCIWRLGGKSPAVFPRWTFAELKDLPQGKGGSVLISRYGARTMPAVERELLDVDTQEALAQIKGKNESPLI